jgi:hypothetical protein
MHKAETRATNRSKSTSYAVGRANLLDYVDLIFVSTRTHRLQLIVNINTSPIPRASLNRLTEMSH